MANDGIINSRSRQRANQTSSFPPTNFRRAGPAVGMTKSAIEARTCGRFIFVFLSTNAILQGMANNVPQIFDRKRLARNRGHAAQATRGFGAHDFLLRHIASELTDRITSVARDFSTGLCLGSSGCIIEAVRSERTKKGYIETLFHADLSTYLVPNDGRGLVCDEERLPFAEASFDLVIALWGLHHVNDLPGALIQIRQILKPNGFFLAALPGGRTLGSLRHALVAAETELLPGVRPHVHPFPDLADLSGLLQRAGFALPVADSNPIEVFYPTPIDLLKDLKGMGESNALTARVGTSLRRDVLMRACEIYTEVEQRADGKCRSLFDICYLAGWAPHESQQQPLKPGSARASLAEALGTVERKL